MACGIAIEKSAETSAEEVGSNIVVGDMAGGLVLWRCPGAGRSQESGVEYRPSRGGRSRASGPAMSCEKEAWKRGSLFMESSNSLRMGLISWLIGSIDAISKAIGSNLRVEERGSRRGERACESGSSQLIHSSNESLRERLLSSGSRLMLSVVEEDSRLYWPDVKGREPIVPIGLSNESLE